ncbi:MAG: hypothetical protein RR595_11880 [Lysinibacillus sp.]
MRQIVKIIRKIDNEKQYEHMLRLDLDYELASLFLAMNEKNVDAIEKCKKRLTEIRQELGDLQVYV